MVSLTHPAPTVVILGALTVSELVPCPDTYVRLVLFDHETVEPGYLFCNVNTLFEVQTTVWSVIEYAA